LEPRNLLNDTIANAGYFYNTCDLALSSNICPIPILVRFPRTLYAPQPKSSLYLHSRIPSGLPSNPLVRQVSLHKSCSPSPNNVDQRYGTPHPTPKAILSSNATIKIVVTIATIKRLMPQDHVSRNNMRLKGGLASYLVITASRCASSPRASIAPVSSSIASNAGLHIAPFGVDYMSKGKR
jgi:hypothetical protein